MKGLNRFIDSLISLYYWLDQLLNSTKYLDAAPLSSAAHADAHGVVILLTPLQADVAWSGALDGVICALSLAMGEAYPYDRVKKDAARFERASPEGDALAWWETYLLEEQFSFYRRPFEELAHLKELPISMVALVIVEKDGFSRLCCVEGQSLCSGESFPHWCGLRTFIREADEEGAIFGAEFLLIKKPGWW